MNSFLTLAHATSEPHSHAEFWIASTVLLLIALTVRRMFATRR